MECVRSRKTPNASVEAGYSHSVALCMTIAAIQTGQRVTFDDATQDVVIGDKEFPVQRDDPTPWGGPPSTGHRVAPSRALGSGVQPRRTGRRWRQMASPLGQLIERSQRA